MDSDTHRKLVTVGNEFYIKLAKLIAESLDEMPPEAEDDTLEYLQDMASVYGSPYEEFRRKR